MQAVFLLALLAMAHLDRPREEVRIRAALERDFSAWADPDRRPWSETTPPRFAVASICFLDPHTAVVEGQVRQYGSLIVVSGLPLRLVMRKHGRSWTLVAMCPAGVKCGRRCACACEP